jgi:pimeloyl-ACP methyl ester carboxylesterase
MVVLLHGIRTEGAWQEMVASPIRESGAQPIPLRYGFLDLIRFLTPGLRQGPVTRVHKQLLYIKYRNPDADIVVVAHSFGTYIITSLLRTNPHLRLKRLVLCGSIVPRDFEWAQIQERVEEEVLNDCGTRDIWPVLAQSVTWGYGASGTFGFGAYGVRDRFHKFSHSEFFNPGFINEYWLPYVLEGTIAESPDDIRPSPPWWQSFLAAFPLRYLIVAALALSILLPLGTRGTEIGPVLLQEVRVRGRVLDPSSRSIGGARVKIDTYERSDSTRTLADGSFSVILLGTAGSTAMMRIEKDGFTPNSTQITVPQRRFSTVVILQPSSPIESDSL